MSNTENVTNEQATPSTELPPTSEKSEQSHYFLVAGEVEFLESKFNKAPRYLKVNGVYPGTGQGITAKDLAKIQTRLQMAFHQKYSRTHQNPPHEITDVVITTCAYLGTHTPEEFTAGMEPPKASTPKVESAENPVPGNA